MLEITSTTSQLNSVFHNSHVKRSKLISRLIKNSTKSKIYPIHASLELTQSQFISKRRCNIRAIILHKVNSTQYLYETIVSQKFLSPRIADDFEGKLKRI